MGETGPSATRTPFTAAIILILVGSCHAATIGALPVAAAIDQGITLAYLPGLAMRRIADLHPDR